MPWTLGAIAVLLLFLLLSIRRLILARLLGLPPPTTRVVVSRGLSIPMPDGVTLVADLYSPASEARSPTLLLRTPYDRAGLSFVGKLFAERGYRVLVQDVRGRGGSEGEFSAASEGPDGGATSEWIFQQDWFDGLLGTWGPSYLGYVQWALAATAPAALKAMVPIQSSPELHGHTFPDGAFSLESRLAWIQALDLKGGWRRMSAGRKLLTVASILVGSDSRRLEEACRKLPMQEADVVVAGRPMALYREMLANASRTDPYWLCRDHSAGLPRIEAPVHLIAGWYDLLLRGTLRVYIGLAEAGRCPYLTVGPWSHTSPGALLAGIREGLSWADAHLKGETSRVGKSPVRVYVMGGAREWRDLETWPPRFVPMTWYLRPDRELSQDSPTQGAAPSRYRYDPSNPTPAVGGACLDRRNTGPKDNRALEARSDVLCFTSPPLLDDLEAIGPVRLTLFVRSSLPHTDFFGRLCDVRPNGRSVNVCDGLFRVEPGTAVHGADGCLHVEVDMWATAWQFPRGHRIRLQVSSGAHPRWSRNPGTGEPLGTAVRLEPAEQTVFHDADHPSALHLPIVHGRER